MTRRTTIGSRDNRASKREEILDEAFALLGDKGYRGLSFQDLANRCGLTKQGVLHYFPTKQGLLLKLLDERDASIEGFLLGQLSSGGFDMAGSQSELRAILEASLVKVVEHMVETPGLIRLHVVVRAEAIGPDHPAKDYFLARDRATLAWLVERMVDSVPAPESTARQVLAAMLGLQQQWLQESCCFDIVDEWQRALSKLLR